MNDELSFEQLTLDHDEILVEPSCDPIPSTVLIVDEHPGVRTRLRDRFWTAGFGVREAATAYGAYETALSDQIDVVVADLALPDSDGWGLLSVFKDDARLCETKVVLMSAESAKLAELLHVRVDADGFVAKTGDIIGAARDTLARRQGILSSMPRGTWGPLADVGVQALLHGACRARLKGMLSVDDGNTTWQVTFDDGVIANARAFCLDSDSTLTDLDALRYLLEVTDAPFTFDAVDGGDVWRTLGKPWSEVAAALCGEVNAKRRRTRAHLLALDRYLSFDVERFRCWTRYMPAPFVAIAQMLYSGAPPLTLLQESSFPRSAVEFVVNDLVRRGVVA